jgi:hypothetical protein
MREKVVAGLLCLSVVLTAGMLCYGSDAQVKIPAAGHDPEDVANQILRLPFDETAGATMFADTSGFNYNGSCSGGTCPAAGQAGVHSSAMSFDGSDDFVQVPHYSAFDFGTTQDFTVMLWVKSGSPHAWGNLISNKSAWHWVTQGFIVAFWQDGATWTANIGDGVNEVHVEGGQINDNNWHHIAATFDRNGDLIIYQDFVEVGRSAISSVGSVSSLQPLSIGRLWDGSGYSPYGGLMDDVRVYSRALSSQEIFDAANVPAVVTSSADSGPGTLREKLAEIASTPITFSDDMTISLASQLIISRSVTVDGTGHTIAVSGSNTCQVFSIRGSSVNLSNLIIRDGYVSQCSGAYLEYYDMGAGVHMDSGANVRMTNCTITDNLNQACYGGGIYNGSSTLYMDNCTISNNTVSDFWGGGLYSLGGTNVIANSTFSGNIAGSGGAIMNDASYLSLQHCTLRNNANLSPYGAGAGIHNRNELSQSVVMNSIVADSSNGPNCGGLANIGGSSAGSLDDDGTCNGITGGFTQSSTLNLGTLGYYGGPTATIPLLPGSAAINAGTTSKCLTTDQRGVPRVDQCDSGAFESKGFTITRSGGDNQSATVNTRFWTPLLVTVTANDTIEPVNNGSVIFTPPGSGASAAIDTSPATISLGHASALAYANGTTGSYSVNAGIVGGNSTDFSLTNLPAIAPPPVGNGKNGTTAATFMKHTSDPDQIDVTYEADQCSASKAVIMYGSLGYFSNYTGCALNNAGNTGTATMDTSGLDNVWFNILWTNGTSGGHPGYGLTGGSDTARTWTAAGLGGVTADDQTHTTCP